MLSAVVQRWLGLGVSSQAQSDGMSLYQVSTGTTNPHSGRSVFEN